MHRVSGHPNIVRLVEGFREDGLGYIIMERCDQTFLAGLEQMPRLTACTFVDPFRQMLQGLAAVHAAGIVHRDVKPDNFLLMHDSTVKLADFGLSVVLGSGVR